MMDYRNNYNNETNNENMMAAEQNSEGAKEAVVRVLKLMDEEQ